MIVLDTNVLSELMRSEPSAAVVAWVEQQREPLLHTTSINKAEILHGIEQMSDGRRKSELGAAAITMFDIDFIGRVLPFDAPCAAHYAQIMLARRRAGRPIANLDAQIAAIAATAGAAVATRNVADFEACGIAIINPWTATA